MVTLANMLQQKEIMVVIRSSNSAYFCRVLSFFLFTEMDPRFHGDDGIIVKSRRDM